MKSDRMLDQFSVIFVFVVMITMGYVAWLISQTGTHWLHLYWIGLGVWGFYVLWRVEEVIRDVRAKEFKEIVDDWVKRGSPDEPLDLKR